MADSLDQIRSGIDARIKELRPLVSELERLEEVKARLDAAAGSDRTGERRSSADGRRRGGAGRGRGRPRKGQPTRAEDFLRIVGSTPGATVAEIAREMGGGVSPNYLYRVRDRLLDQGAIRQDGKGFVATDASVPRSDVSAAGPEHDEHQMLEDRAGRGEEDRSDTPLPPDADPHPDLPGDA